MRCTSSLKPFFFFVPLLLIILFASAVPAQAGELRSTTLTTPTVPSLNNTTGNVTTYGVLNVVIALVFTFGLFVLALISEDPFLQFIDGVVWIFAGILIFLTYNIGWMIVSWGVGLYLMVLAGYNYRSSRKEV